MLHRRRAHRAAFGASTFFHRVGDERVYSGAIRDISRVGCSVHTYNLPEIGETIDLHFRTPMDAGPICLRARVVRACREDEALLTEDVGFGALFTFDDLPREDDDPVEEGDDRRQSLRVPYETILRFESDGFTESHTGFIQDLSRGGLFVHTYNLPALGEQVSVRVRIPEIRHEPFDLRAEVRWVRPDDKVRDPEEVGFGASFLDLPPEADDAFERILDALAPSLGRP